MCGEHKQREIAASFEAPEELLPLIPELLEELWELGSSPRIIVDMLRLLELPSSATRMLDLGCGKGAVSITLALELGFQVSGIDLFEPFIMDARRRAEESGVALLCQFRVGDMCDAVREGGDYDIVVYASVGGILGDFTEQVRYLRATVRPGGYLVIDDGYLTRDRSTTRSGYRHYRPHDETVRMLTVHGDILVREKMLSPEESRSINEGYLTSIRRRARNLTRRHPHLAGALREYVARQAQECEFLDRTLTGATWLLRRT
ncbi:MAG: class I SAM-dependent methyltransferase [Candidatus Marinimicrobia bacterium]|nr:class I SAM-dependent methyltransferase [Candidatus Neomarinimicrobiota bacterium]